MERPGRLSMENGVTCECLQTRLDHFGVDGEDGMGTIVLKRHWIAKVCTSANGIL